MKGKREKVVKNQKGFSDEEYQEKKVCYTN